MKHDSTTLIAGLYDRFADSAGSPDYLFRSRAPGPQSISKQPAFLSPPASRQQTCIEKMLIALVQMQRSNYNFAERVSAGGAVFKTQPNLMFATETLQSRLTERGIRFYPR